MELQVWGELAAAAFAGGLVVFACTRRRSSIEGERIVVRRFRWPGRRLQTAATAEVTVIAHGEAQPVEMKAAELHDLRLNSVENTEGRRVGVFKCVLCEHSHIERRELESISAADA